MLDTQKVKILHYITLQSIYSRKHFSLQCTLKIDKSFRNFYSRIHILLRPTRLLQQSSALCRLIPSHVVFSQSPSTCKIKTAAVIVYNVPYLISDKFDSIFTVLRNNSQWLGCHRYVQYTFRILPRLNKYMTMTFLHLSLHFTIHFHADTTVAYFFAHIIFTTIF